MAPVVHAKDDRYDEHDDREIMCEHDDNDDDEAPMVMIMMMESHYSSNFLFLLRLMTFW